jgi:electron transfer flavoprotein alpha subunit
MPAILAFAETRAGELRKVALETVTAARQAADASGGGEVHALIIGGAGLAKLAEALGRHGADVVIVVADDGLDRYNPEVFASTVADRLRRGGYRAGIFSASAQGRDLAPRVAAKTGVSLASDVTDFELTDDALVAHHPAYTGKVVVTLRLTGSPALLSVRPGTITPAEQPRPGKVETASPAIEPSAARVIVTELSQRASTRLDLGEASSSAVGGGFGPPRTSSWSRIWPRRSGTQRSELLGRSPTTVGGRRRTRSARPEGW